MSKFTFVCQEDPHPLGFPTPMAKKTVEFNADSLMYVIEEFEMFLKGCGFSFDGHIDIVEDDWDGVCNENNTFNSPPKE